MMMVTMLCVVGFALGLYIGRRITQVKEPVEKLKNALLSLAMSRVFRPKGVFDDLNFNYNGFDGTRLPMMSGCSVGNACFAYIQGKKAAAIEKFIHKNLATEKAVLEFFDEFASLGTARS